MFQAVLDIHLQKNNGESKNYLMVTNLISDLYVMEQQINSAINNCKRSYNNLPICEITVIVFDVSNKLITHYKDIEITEYSYNESVATAQLAKSETTKKDYSNLFANYEYALVDMQKNNKGR